MLDIPILEKESNSKSKVDPFIQNVLQDYWISLISREASLLGRKEVLTGKAKFGILGDGKEVPQVAMARAFKKGDFRTGYYRDQTFMFALGLSTIENFFAQLYADSANDPFSGGRQMNSHYATPLIDSSGNWVNHTKLYNVTSDISSTGGQMARALGIALASKKYRALQKAYPGNKFSNKGNEVSFCTIGDASTSEGVFWETMNAAAVMKVPLAVSVWDDGYGISVPKELQTVKNSISKALEGMLIDENGNGIYIYRVNAWDYPALVSTYDKVIKKVRENHIPALIHVEGVTQPQGHSTSGSHERYKSEERMSYEKEMDCIRIMGDWMVNNKIVSRNVLEQWNGKAKQYVKECQKKAWNQYQSPVKNALEILSGILSRLISEGGVNAAALTKEKDRLHALMNPSMAEIVEIAKQAQYLSIYEPSAGLNELESFIAESFREAEERFHTHLYNEGPGGAIQVPYTPPVYTENSKRVTGYQVLNTFFDIAFERDNKLMAFGEDVGKIGDVNQGFAGLQEKFGEERVFDVGIREWTIMGQAIGLAMRGFRPIAEIQYLDYLIYGIEPLSDDLATLRYRSAGQQKAPAIIRTRGHRLEGIWHAGSPLGMLLGALRGMYLCVPRNMVQAAGFYNTLLRSDDPALVIECLNGYRLKETLPDNIGDYTIPLGMPEVLHEGVDVTLVSYGSCIRVAQRAMDKLAEHGISVELIDVQTLLPFDLEHSIVASVSKTNRLVLLDEDFPGGGTAYMMREILEVQQAYRFLDSSPVCITAKAHRTPYGSDGDYFTKPNPEDVFEHIYNIMHEADPQSFPYSFNKL